VKHAGSLRVKMLHRVFDVKEEIVTFISDISDYDDKNLFYSEKFIQELL
jgi:hypothetical protein